MRRVAVRRVAVWLFDDRNVRLDDLDELFIFEYLELLEIPGAAGWCCVVLVVVVLFCAVCCCLVCCYCLVLFGAV